MTKRPEEIQFLIGGLRVEVQSEYPIYPSDHSPPLQKFISKERDRADITIRHKVGIPRNSNSLSWGHYLGHHFFLHLFQNQHGWTFVRTDSEDEPSLPNSRERIVSIASLNRDHTNCEVIHKDEYYLQTGNISGVFSISTDLLLFAIVFAKFEACYFHASGIRFEDKGYLFLGHSGAGKSTISKILTKHKNTQLMCDDRILLRKWPSGFKIHGTWNHGEIEEVSPEEVKLHSIFFLVQSMHNKVDRISDRKEIYINLLKNLYLPLTTSDWYENIFSIFDTLVSTIPCYYLHFNKSEEVTSLIRQIGNDK